MQLLTRVRVRVVKMKRGGHRMTEGHEGVGREALRYRNVAWEGTAPSSENSLLIFR